MDATVASRQVAFEFKAFISYSHADRVWAERLHRELEAFRIDRALHGFPTPVGKIPDSLTPIFRDRTELVAAQSLSEELRVALRVSRFLIVLCSPAAAASAQVGEEIRYFRGLGRQDSILTMIVDGEADAPVESLFPPALSEGTRDAATPRGFPLAADARKHGDGWANAKLKLVGGLLGLPLAVLERRQEERQKRERYLWAGAVAAFGALAVLAGLSALGLSRSTHQTRLLIDASAESTARLVKTTARLADGLGVSAAAAVEILQGIEQSYDTYLGHGDDPKWTVRVKRASMLLEFARHYGKLKQPKDQMRTVELALAELDALPVPPRGEAQAGNAIVGLKATAHWLRGEAHFSDAKYEAALADFLLGLNVIGDGDERYYSERMRLEAEQYIPRARLMLGSARAQLRLTRGENPLGGKQRALELAKKAVAMGRNLHLDTRRESDRDAAELMVDARYLVADLIRQLNNREQELLAEANINDGLASALHLHAQEPGRTSLVQRAANLYLARADLHRWRGESHSAYQDYKLARDLRGAQYQKDPSDRALKFSFAFNLIKVGEELITLRQAREAIAEFEYSERLLAELRKERPDDSVYRYWFWTAIQGQGHAFRHLGDTRREIAFHRRKLVIAREHWDQAPDGVDSRLVLGESHRDYGNVLIAHGNIAGGLEHLNEAHRLLAPAVAAASPDWRFMRMQASILESIARAHLARRQFLDARDTAEEAYKLREMDSTRTGKLDPHAQADMAENRRLIASIQLANAQCREARKLYQVATLILDRLVRDHPMPNPEWLEKFKAARGALETITWTDAGPDCSDGPVDRKMGDMIAMARQLAR